MNMQAQLVLPLWSMVLLQAHLGGPQHVQGEAEDVHIALHPTAKAGL